ncbi:hypothetical protein F5X99DRAFT_404764 [Biscogniauxia marginata]|nr:hypothetical protein F5X99DRAFT_404764 [Biscogniauxia marginata]
MATTRKRDVQFRLALYSALQTVFALFLFALFIIAFVIQSGGITLPEWAKTWQDAPPELLPGYAGALLGSICVIAAVCIAAGIILIRSEAKKNRRGERAGGLRNPRITGYGISQKRAIWGKKAPWE